MFRRPTGTERLRRDDAPCREAERPAERSPVHPLLAATSGVDPPAQRARTRDEALRRHAPQSRSAPTTRRDAWRTPRCSRLACAEPRQRVWESPQAIEQSRTSDLAVRLWTRRRRAHYTCSGMSRLRSRRASAGLVAARASRRRRRLSLWR